jgi:hypothetical protein
VIEPNRTGGQFDGEDADAVKFVCRPHSAIDNRLALNAHDSHAIVPVRDFGIACQLSHVESFWKIRCNFCSPASQPTVELELKGTELSIQTEDQTASVFLGQRDHHAIWIVIAMIDGFLIVGNQNEEWLRRELPSTEVDGSPLSSQTTVLSETKAPISIKPIAGKLAVDQLLVFRDLYYRGNGDSARQTWEPSEQIILLGDNVSSSSDSRNRWPEGLSPNAVKGVVLQTDSVMETLLRQR